MNILFLTSQIPYPPVNGARKETWNAISMLSKTHTVHLLSFIRSEIPDDDLNHMKNICASVRTVKLHKDSLPALLYRNFTSGLPVNISRYYSREFADAFQSFLRCAEIDVIRYDNLHMSQYANCAPEIPSVLRAHNVESVILKRYLAQKRNPFVRLAGLYHYGRLKRFEMSQPAKVTLCLPISQKDKIRFNDLNPEITCKTIPFALDTVDYEFSPEERDNRTILFTGLYSWAPNEDAMIYFHSEIFPFIKNELPDAHLIIAGAEPGPKIMNMHNPPNIRVTGYIEDIMQYFRKAAVFVTPVRIGGGIRIKILEAMASGIPVVSTSVGYEGIDIENGRDILIADTPEEFASHVVMLLKDPALRKEISENARERVMMNHSFEAVAPLLNEAFQSVKDSR